MLVHSVYSIFLEKCVMALVRESMFCEFIMSNLDVELVVFVQVLIMLLMNESTNYNCVVKIKMLRGMATLL